MIGKPQPPGMNPPRRALVVGGGIAGPAVALFFARAGIEPVVLEAYPRSEDVGGGFQIAPNGLRVLAELGLADTLLAQGHPCNDMAFRNHQGRLIGVARTARAGCAVNVMRASVHRVLRDEVTRRGIDIRYEKRLIGIAEAGDEVVAAFEDGTTEVGDFLVGADGVHSRVRACILPQRAAPRDTQMISIGGFCAPGVTPPPDPDDAGRLTFMVGSRYQFGYSKMSAAQWGWWCHAHAADVDERTALMAMPFSALRDRMLDRYRGWSAPVHDFIASTEAWLRTPIHDVPGLPIWRRGRVLLLGDAAHAMSPAGGQGASLALEDAMIFGQLAAHAETPIEDAMARFESLRRRRAERMVAQGYDNDRRSLKELGPFGMWMRDRVMMPVFASFIERALNEVYTATTKPTVGKTACQG
jgi:2-polyprenyl-6-methoxyphenol hydroxylase-like FAD-dependent oxidoreductase